MSAVSQASTCAKRSLEVKPRLAAAGALLASRWIAFPLIFFLCAVLAVQLGKDVNWDQLQHHFYLGFSALNNRFELDFLPSSVQSYFIPYPYVPFYLLASSNLDDRWVAVILSTFSAVALCAVWEMSGRLTGAILRSSTGFSVPAAWAGTLLGALAPVYFVQVGSSFVDAPLAALVLWGYVLLLRLSDREESKAFLVIVAALLLGVSAGLKQSNALFAVAALPLLLLSLRKSRLPMTALFAFVGLLSSAAVAFPWHYQVWKAFGNPFFPMFNAWFKSDLFPLVNTMHLRFIPIDFIDALIRPLWMASPEKLIYTDPPAPDARFIALLILIPIALLSIGLRVLRYRDLPFLSLGGCRQLIAAWLTLGSSWVIWLHISGNGRYFMPMILMAAPILVATIAWISPTKRWNTYAVGFVLLVQGALVFMGAAPRYAVSEWTEKWFAVTVPAALQREPAVFLSLGMEPSAFLVPYLHPESSFVSVGSQYALGVDRPGWRRVSEVMSTSRPVWLLTTVDFAENDGSPSRPREIELRNSAARLGLSVKFQECVDVTLDGMPTSALRLGSQQLDAAPLTTVNSMRKYYVACPAITTTDDLTDFHRREALASSVFDRLEEGCPALFTPRGPTTESRGNAWWRFYMDSDISVWLDEGVVYFYRAGMYQLTKIGTESEVLQGKVTAPCNRRRDELIVVAEVRPWWWGLSEVSHYVLSVIRRIGVPV